MKHHHKISGHSKALKRMHLSSVITVGKTSLLHILLADHPSENETNSD